jgi:hypothetical protein
MPPRRQLRLAGHGISWPGASWLTATPERVRVALSSPVGLRVRRTWRLRSEEIDPLFHREGTSATGGKRWQTPSLPCARRGNWSQRTATVLACFCGPRGGSICDRLPLVATTGLHKGSILRCQAWRQPQGGEGAATARRASETTFAQACWPYFKASSVVLPQPVDANRPRWASFSCLLPGQARTRGALEHSGTRKRSSRPIPTRPPERARRGP